MQASLTSWVVRSPPAAYSASERRRGKRARRGTPSPAAGAAATRPPTASATPEGGGVDGVSNNIENNYGQTHAGGKKSKSMVIGQCAPKGILCKPMPECFFKIEWNMLASILRRWRDLPDGELVTHQTPVDGGRYWHRPRGAGPPVRRPREGVGIQNHFVGTRRRVQTRDALLQWKIF